MDFQLSYRDVNKDIERWMKKFGTPDVLEGGTKVLRGLGKAQQFVYDAYFEAKAYDALVRYAVWFNEIPPGGSAPQDYGLNPVQARVLQALLSDREIDHTKRLWEGVVAKRKRYYAGTVRSRKKYPDLVPLADVERHKSWAAHAMRCQIQSLQELGESEAARQATAGLDEFLNKRLPS